MDYIAIFINDTQQKIKIYTQQIEELHSSFEKLNKTPNRQFAHEIVFGLLVSEYILKLKKPTIDDDVDAIFLWGRKLLEILIVIKYLLRINSFNMLSEYCDRDRYEYLEGLFYREKADDKLFAYLNIPHCDMSTQKEEIEQIIKRHGKKPQKMPSMKQMAETVDYMDEYNYFYKLSSKMLHFCPFTLNGDSDFNSNIHKSGYIHRGTKYLEELVEGLKSMYQKTLEVS